MGLFDIFKKKEQTTEVQINENGKPKIRFTSLFSGIGMQERGLENAGVFDIDVIQTCEMDSNAIISYAAIHNGLTNEMIENYDFPSREDMISDLEKLNIDYDFKKKKAKDWKKKINSKKKDIEKVWLACQLNHNVGDISLVNKLEETDMVSFSFPCQDLSLAGAQKGIVEGETRSGLVYEVIRILKNMSKDGQLPSYLLMENVDALINKKNKPSYDALNEEFDDLGYNVYYQTMNAKWCGIPQNRNRVFAWYIRKDIDNGEFTFPLEFDNGMRLKDVLEDEVDEKFYITSDKAQELIDKLIEDGTLDE